MVASTTMGVVLAVALCLTVVFGDDTSQCCSTKAFEVTKRGEVLKFGCGSDESTIAKLDTWFSGDADNALRISANKAAWKLPSGATPLWLAFAGDSELRLEFWLMVRHFGQGFRYAGRSAAVSCCASTGERIAIYTWTVQWRAHVASPRH